MGRKRAETEDKWLFVPLPYDDPKFAVAWQAFMDYKKEIKKEYKSETSVKVQLDWFLNNNYKVDQAIELIYTAIRLGWTGIWPTNTQSHGTLSRAPIGTSFNATESAFANLQRNINSAIGEGDDH